MAINERLHIFMSDGEDRRSWSFMSLRAIFIGAVWFCPLRAVGFADGGGHWLDIVSIDIRVNAGDDDAEELNETGHIYLDSADLELTYDDSHGGNQTVGLRFGNVQIERGDKIHNAYIQFTVDQAEQTSTCNLTFTGQAVDDAEPFTSEERNISGRWPTTSARVMWRPPVWESVDSAGYDQMTPRISSVIQEIVDRPGWVRGNAIVVIITGTGSRVAKSYEGGEAKAPLLHVEFSRAGTDVNFVDFALFGNDWLASGPGLASDIDGDWAVDFNDLRILATSWLCGCDRIDSYSEYSYSVYFACNDNVADASINTLNQETLEYFWDFIAELENTGAIEMAEPADKQDCNDPDYCRYIYLTAQESERILAAKMAHSIWLDRNNMLPWTIRDYSQDELAGLFDPGGLFSGNESAYYYFSVVDHSPSEVYSYIADNDLLKGDELDTLYAVLDDVRADFRHGNTSDENRNTAYNVREALSTYASNNMRVSRVGCHSSTRIIIAMLRSVNVPGEETNSGTWYENGHSSAVWPTLETVLPHGDHIYNALIRATPSDELLPTFSFYDVNLNTAPCGASTVCLSHRHASLNAVKYPADWTLSRSCDPARYGYESCEDYIYDQHSRYLTTEEMDAAVTTLEAICGAKGNEPF